MFYFGSYLPLSARGVSTCVKNAFQEAISSTFDENTAETAGTALLLSTGFGGSTGDDPCPKCVGDGTANNGVEGGTCAARSGYASSRWVSPGRWEVE